MTTQYGLFSSDDNKQTGNKKASKATPISMFDDSEFFVPAKPLPMYPEWQPTMMLEKEDTRTEAQKELDAQAEAKALTIAMFEDKPSTPSEYWHNEVLAMLQELYSLYGKNNAPYSVVTFQDYGEHELYELSQRYPNYVRYTQANDNIYANDRYEVMPAISTYQPTSPLLPQELRYDRAKERLNTMIDRLIVVKQAKNLTISNTITPSDLIESVLASPIMSAKEQYRLAYRLARQGMLDMAIDYKINHKIVYAARLSEYDSAKALAKQKRLGWYWTKTCYKPLARIKADMQWNKQAY